MNIQDLPNELQNKIFYYTAEHPCAKMIKDIYQYKIVDLIDFKADENGKLILREMIIHRHHFKIGRLKDITLSQRHSRELYWNNLINLIHRRKKYREELGDHYVDL